MDIRFAEESDWPQLSEFFGRIYRPSHPLQNQEFWNWRFGDSDFGSSVIAVSENKIIGHVGVNRSGGIAWIINTYLDAERRGQGILSELYGLAATRGELAATNVNGPGVGMYRKMGWTGHANLRRFVLSDETLNISELTEPVHHKKNFSQPGTHHFWRQPGIRGILAKDGSTCVDFLYMGGIRMVEIIEPESILDLMKSFRVNWADYVTSWNDPLCDTLEAIGWKLDEQSNVPWLFDPFEPTSRMKVNVFAKHPLPSSLIIRRWDSDHGRVGSIR